jgi:hypothetical protein
MQRAVPSTLRGFARLSALCLLGLVAFCLVILSQQTPAMQRNRSTSQPPNRLTPQPPSPVSVRILFPAAEDSPLPGGLAPIVVEVRESLNERGVFWMERLMIGSKGRCSWTPSS